jgi:iron only hydrogenase large subunit-like protein
MIAEEKKDLVDRREFYQAVTKKMEQKGGANLDTTLTLREIVEIFKELPAHDELSAEWIKESDKWVCTWCSMGSHAPYTTKYCPCCGRRMKVKVRLGEK